MSYIMPQFSAPLITKTNPVHTTTNIQIDSSTTAVLGIPPDSLIRLPSWPNASTIIARLMFSVVADRYFGKLNNWTLLSLPLYDLIFAFPSMQSQIPLYLFPVLFGLCRWYKHIGLDD
ncbi:hypothetical protein QQS21_000174 [Conoideocrella luteorostrata]|uniref:Uncharacterized protein n=1 Tax=Conoideocrella luteorostrata TaxID=1105319 RepID=A0AAJ0D196_9HYPO|nr:hypothetical protein QQS21_000174 [Conoideocrella luteorostrata]